MVINALFPFVATIAYVPLLFATIRNRPLQTRHKLFILLVVAAMLWSLFDFLLRGRFMPQYDVILVKLVITLCIWTAVQFHCFASSFYAPGQGRFLSVAYISLMIMIALVALDYIPESITSSNGLFYTHYGVGVLFVATPIMVLLVRSLYLLWNRLKILDNVVLRNQLTSLIITAVVLAVFILSSLLPFGKEFPIAHFGNLVVAFILSYATVRHQLVDIRFILRRGLAWISLGIIGTISYWLLFTALHILFRFEINLTLTFVATAVAILVSIFVYRLRDTLFATVGKAFVGKSRDD